MAEEKPRVFTRIRESDSEKITRLAYTPAEVVKLQFDGWAEVTGAEATRTVAAAERGAADAEKPAAADAVKPDSKK